MNYNWLTNSQKRGLNSGWWLEEDLALAEMDDVVSS